MYVCQKEVFKPSETLNQKGYRPPVVVKGDQCTACESCMILCPDLAVVVAGVKSKRGVKK
jgi:NAD-dependent dihydropyrimidine dehydrogenase PreA subunit